MKILLTSLCLTALVFTSAPTLSIEWENCRLEAPNTPHTVPAQCSQLRVKEDRTSSDSKSRTIRLNLANLPSTSNKHEPDPILFLAGGPGQSAIESYVQVQSGFSQLIKDRNVYLVDQRGTGKSNPLNCEIEPHYLLTKPDDETNLKIIKNCLDNLDADTRFYTTTESIKDLEEVRKALNIKQWNLIGISYGTRKALTYAKLYPDAIRTMILDGVAPQQEALGENHEQNLLSALKLQFAECKKQAPCNEAFGDVQSTLDQLLEQSDKNPMRVQVFDPITGKPTDLVLTREILTMVVRMFSYTSNNYRLLPLLLNLAKNNQPENITSQGLIIFNSMFKSLSLGMDLSVICSEDAPFYTMQNDSKPFFSDKAMSETRKKQCESWPHVKVGADFKQPVHSDIPTLLLSGEYDPVTPPKFAETAAKTLSNSQHLIAKGFGHGVFMRGCMPYIIRDFIDEPAKPLDIQCMKDFATPPFFIDLMGPKQ